MNKSRKRKQSYREMAAEAGVSVGHISKAVKVDELGRSDEVISGEKTVNEILREEGLLKKTDFHGQCVRALPKLTTAELSSLLSELLAELDARHEEKT